MVMPTSPSSFTKQPYEEFVIGISFKKRLDSDETITAKTVTATLSSADATSTVIAGSEIGTDEYAGYILIGVKGGVTGSTYKITTKITTDKQLPDDSYQKFESDINMRIVET